VHAVWRTSDDDDFEHEHPSPGSEKAVLPLWNYRDAAANEAMIPADRPFVDMFESIRLRLCIRRMVAAT
jgi:hypothetical protein